MQFYSDEDTLSQFGRLTRVYTALSNYTRAAVRENTELHTPVIRPLFLMFEEDEEAFSQEYEYMLGRDLLVAPVLAPGVESWPVYLPGPEVWLHLWTGQALVGPSYNEVSAPLGHPPVFYRADSVWTETFENIRDQFAG